MPLLVDPVAADDGRLLRTAVLHHATTERRRRFPPVLHVGIPAGATLTLVDERDWDHGLRPELVGAVLRSLDDPAGVWLTRGGPPATQEAEMSWLGPTIAAASERGTD